MSPQLLRTFLQQVTSTQSPKRHQRIWQAGFTIVELLVSLVVSVLVLAATGQLIVRIMEVDQREAAYAAVQSEMQLSMDYIRRDLEDAVFVYTGQQLQDQLLGTPAYISTTDTPVLAFWKIRPAEECINQATAPVCVDANVNGLGNVTARGSVAVLVVYYWVENTTNVWEVDEFGQARIARIELDPFVGPRSDSPPSGVRGDYLAPDPSDFLSWPYGTTLATFNGSQSRKSALMAHIGHGDDAEPPAIITCPTGYEPSPAAEAGGPPSDNNAHYALYACVRPSGGTGDQDVLIYLQGSAEARAGGAYEPGTLQLENLETRVFTRGQFGRGPTRS